MNDSQNYLFMESTNVKEKKEEKEENKNVDDSNFNPYAVNSNNNQNNPFDEGGFNKSLANSISNPYADTSNNNIEIKKSNMQESIVDDVKFKDHIPDFKNNNDDDFPK